MFCDQPYLGCQDATAAAAGPWSQRLTQGCARLPAHLRSNAGPYRGFVHAVEANRKGGGLSWFLQRLAAVLTPGKCAANTVHCLHKSVICLQCLTCLLPLPCSQHAHDNLQTCIRNYMKSPCVASGLAFSPHGHLWCQSLASVTVCAMQYHMELFSLWCMRS